MNLLYEQAQYAIIYGYSFKSWLEICQNAREHEEEARAAYQKAFNNLARF